ncbi:hypothetical protein C1X65_02790 [Pseudomonas sp. FW305-70]|nr:hypothetical protein C1X65_02790 [Pseudomonas sp. FW305-70]
MKRPRTNEAFFFARIFNLHDSMWERACSRKRLNIQQRCCLTHRFREQARSHRFFCVRVYPAWPASCRCKATQTG